MRNQNLVRLATVFSVASAWASALDLSALPPLPGKTIALVNIAAVDTNSAERIRLFVQQSLVVPIRLVNVEAPATKGLLSLGRSCIPLMTTNDACFVALAVPDEAVDEPILIAPDNNWAVVNASCLRTQGIDTETLLRRMERQVMRSIAHLFGVAYCPEPRCVNHHVTSVEELDDMGRNFCPPTLEAFQREAMLRGMEVITLRPPRWLRRHGYLEKKDAQATPGKPAEPSPER